MTCKTVRVVVPTGPLTYTGDGGKHRYDADYFASLYTNIAQAVSEFDGSASCERISSRMAKQSTEAIAKVLEADLVIVVATGRSSLAFWMMGVRMGVARVCLVLHDRVERSELGPVAGSLEMAYDADDAEGLRRDLRQRFEAIRSNQEPALVQSVVGPGSPTASTGSVAKYDLFVSYSHDDQARADKIEAEAKARGLNVFVSLAALESGVDQEQAIREALFQSAEVCLLATPNSLISDWVTCEYGAAWFMYKRITSLLHGITGAQLPQRLQRYVWREFDERGAYLDEVAKRRQERLLGILSS